jgi:hypothetical protein
MVLEYDKNDADGKGAIFAFTLPMNDLAKIGRGYESQQ